MRNYFVKDKITFLFDHIVSAVIGANQAKRLSQKLVHEWLTVSDEAFALLCYHNYYNWVKDKTINSNRSTVTPL